MNIISTGPTVHLNKIRTAKPHYWKCFHTPWSWLLQNLPCTRDMHGKHPAETQNICKHNTVSLNGTLGLESSWVEVNYNLELVILGWESNLKPKSTLLLLQVIRGTTSILNKLLFHANYLLRIKEQMKLSNQFQEFV